MNPNFTLKYLEQSSQWLQKLIQTGKFKQLSFKKRQQLLSRIEQLQTKLSKFGQFQQVRKVVAASTVVLSMAFGNTATAQNFTTLQNNPFGLTSGYNVTFPAAADMDDDGDFDFLIGDANGGIRYFKNTGDSTLPAFSQITTNSPTANISGYYFAMPSLVDIDDDGDYDLFVTEYYGAINFFENIGTPTAPIFSTAQTAFGINTASFNQGFVNVQFVDY
ncbi:MAG: hypothetical protein HC803_01440 [Saprospiraceae bacterium]|nr:hypothetical protein [Saprospiraceae bacterium]